MTTEIDRVKCWISTERLRQKEVLDRETGMVFNVKTTTTTPISGYPVFIWNGYRDLPSAAVGSSDALILLYSGTEFER